MHHHNKLTFILGVIIILLIGWALAHSTRVSSKDAQKHISDFASAKDTLYEKDQNLPTQFPEQMPEDFEARYTYNAPQHSGETEIIINNKQATIRRNKKTWDLKLEPEHREKIYSILMTRSFDTIETSPLDAQIDSTVSIHAEASYTQEDAQVAFEVLVDNTRQIKEGDADRWLDIIQLFSGIASFYP